MRYFRVLTASLTRFGTPFGLSLLIHAIILLVFWLMAGDPTGSRLRPQDLTVVELLESPELARRPQQKDKDIPQNVRMAPAPPELLTEKEVEKRYASEDTQTVIEEQKAREVGKTRNRSSVLGDDRQNRREKMTAQKKLDLRPESTLQKMAQKELGGGLGDVSEQAQPKPVVNSGRPLDFSRFGSVERGVSSVGDVLRDDIKIGDFTALNTDRHLYYSFYSRMEDKIRGRWTNYVRSVIYGLENGMEVVRGRPSWTTRLEIVLDKDGTFEKAILHQSSGSRGLDSAPVQAFRDAQQFPHPPAEMIKDEDGKIHLDYAFTVEMIPRYASASPAESD